MWVFGEGKLKQKYFIKFFTLYLYEDKVQAFRLLEKMYILTFH